MFSTQKLFLFILLGFLTSTTTKAQFYVNMEGGIKWDIIQTFASKGDFSYINKGDFMGGAILGYEVNPYLFLECGVYVQQLNNRYVYQLDGVNWLKNERWLPAQFVQFPFRVKTAVMTIDKNLSLQPYIGLCLLVHRHESGTYEQREYQIAIEAPNSHSFFHYQYSASFRSRYLMLGEAGLSARYKITRQFSLLCSLGFLMGSTTIHETFVFWNRKMPAFKDEGVVNAQYKGDQISFMIGVQCVFQE